MARGREVIGLSRWVPGEPAGRHFLVDLTDAADCWNKLGALRSVRHLVYAAPFEKPNLGAG